MKKQIFTNSGLMSLLLIVTVLITVQNAKGQAWKLTGNSGTNSSTNFVGTTDNLPLKIRTNNVLRINVTSTGKVGVGNFAPVFKLDVKGGSINTDSVYRIGGNTVLSVKGNQNVFTGVNSGHSNTFGIHNTVIGHAALFSNTEGNYNTTSGYQSLYYNTIGSDNTASGWQTMFLNTTAGQNVAIGSFALSTQSYSNSNAAWNSGNVAIGYEALYSNEPTSTANGIHNTAVGTSALFANNTGIHNTANGYLAMYSNTIGDNNTAIGASALYSNTTGHSNTVSGNEALYSNTEGHSNTANGVQALYSNLTGYNNTANGSYALYSNTTGTGNTASGIEALNFNIAGVNNTAMGRQALQLNEYGNGNTACGFGALSFNNSGSLNSAFGREADFHSGNLSNTSCIGYSSGGIVKASNRVEIGNSSVGVIAGQVGWSTYSDMRIKDNVKEDVPGLAFISKLRPVTYNLNIHRENAMVYKGTKKDETDWEGKYDLEKVKMTGFLAQDVEKAAKETGYDFSGVQKPANPDELYSLRYSDFVMPLVKAVQELNVELKSEVSILKSDIANLKSEIRNLKSEGHATLNAKSEILFQNSPNPFTSETEIKFQLPAQFYSAILIISDENGKQIRTCNLQSKMPVIIKAGELSAGIYSYSLIVDGTTMDTKQMILTK
ncbi:MAG: tail fiber domain-containing protein [Bacteroidota bacterium]